MTNLKGKLLIAPPNVRGNFWAKTVILITEHSHQGSLGIVIGKKSKLTIREFMSQCGLEADVPGMIYIGGPVNVKALTMLHSAEWSCGNTLHINNELSISSSPDLLHRIAMNDRPINYRLILGLCVWSPDQLDSEINGKPPYSHDFSWLLATPNQHLIFGADGSDQWTQSIELSGSEFVQKLLD